MRRIVGTINETSITSVRHMCVTESAVLFEELRHLEAAVALYKWRNNAWSMF